MRIVVKAKARAKTERVEPLPQPDAYRVSVKEPAVDGRANEAIARALAAHFGVAPSTVRLISGRTGPLKRFDIPGV